VHCEEALSLHRELGPGIVQATAWDSLGYAHHHLGDHPTAIACYNEALGLFRDLGDRYSEAQTLARLGDTHAAADNPDDARAAWLQAAMILDDIDHPDAKEVRAKL
jgi:tetratricopeptide (TPR) repeat protein